MSAASVDLEELKTLACRLAVEAGKLVVAGRAKGISVCETKSTATDLVTEYDRQSEELIVAGLRAARPDDGIVGEEGTATPGTSGIHWLVDPIDGTTNFTYGLAGYAVSIAAATSPDPCDAVAAAVYLPVTAELFSATRGGGATLNGAPIRCSQQAELAKALVGSGFSYGADRRAVQGARMARLLPRIRDLRRLGAAAADLCFVACGRLDAYFEQWLGPWDIAAGGLIAREAGCVWGGITGGGATPASVLAANPALYAALTAAIREIDGVPAP